jgi:DNA-binding NarL/FixJ family response regulator
MTDRGAVSRVEPAEIMGDSQSQRAEDRSITVVVGCFEPLVGYGLERVLSADGRLRVLGCGLDGRGIERAVAQRRPRVAILGETVEHGLLARVKARQPGLGVLVVVNSPTTVTGTALLEMGATCLPRVASVSDVLTAVHLAAQGKLSFFTAEHRHLAGGGPVVADVLTKRETQVFDLLSRGWSYARIGHKLQIAPETARTHSQRICGKLHIKNKRDLIGMTLTMRLEAS